MEKVASRQFYYFYISIFNETPKQTQTNYYWVLKEEQRIVNLLQQGFLCVFPLAVLFGKGFSCGGMKYSVEYYFRGKHLVSEKIRGLVGEICGGIISDISVHFVRCPLDAAKFKITPFFTLDSGKGNSLSLKQDFQVFFRVFRWKSLCSSCSTLSCLMIINKDVWGREYAPPCENYKIWRNMNCRIQRVMLDRKSSAVAQHIRNWATTNLVGGWRNMLAHICWI